MSYLSPALYKPPVHLERYPRNEVCGTLISADGQEDRRCDVMLLKRTAVHRCPVCAARRRALAVRKAERKAGR